MNPHIVSRTTRAPQSGRGPREATERAQAATMSAGDLLLPLLLPLLLLLLPLV